MSSSKNRLLLIATAYQKGAYIPNFVILPFAANVRERTNHELLLQKIITEGSIAIDSEVNPVILKTKLDSFLTPPERFEELDQNTAETHEAFDLHDAISPRLKNQNAGIPLGASGR